METKDYLRWYTNKRYRKTGRQPSIHTLQVKRAHIRTAAEITGSSSEEELGTVLADRARWDDLLDKLSVRMSSGTMRNAVYALRDFGDYAVAKGLIRSHVVQETDIPPKNPPKPITVYSAEEMELFVNAARAKGLRWWLLVTFVADTGRRIGEALNLRWDQFRPGSPPYFELPTNKTGEPQYVPVTRRLAAALTPENIAHLKAEKQGPFRGAYARDPEVFVFPWSYSTAMGRLRRFSEALGIEYRGFHNFRHTVITERLARGVPIQAIAALGGYTSPGVMLSRYNHATALDYARFMEEAE